MNKDEGRVIALMVICQQHNNASYNGAAHGDWIGSGIFAGQSDFDGQS